jgi:hypothetical protein
MNRDHADRRSYERHIDGKKHKQYMEIKASTKKQQARLVAGTLAPSEGHYARIALDGTRQTSVSIEDYQFRSRVLRMCLGAKIPVNALGKIRTTLEDMTKLSLKGRTSILANHLQPIIAGGLELQIEELKGKKVSLCFDGTPRLGDVFAMVARYVEVRDGKAKSRQRLIHLAFAKKSMNGPNVCAEVSSALRGKRLFHADVVAASVDGCSVNIAAHAAIEKDYDIVWMLCLCLSHSTNNGGDEASFVILHQFWTLIQKCFSQSDNAKIIWEKHTKQPWKTYSTTRWFSKYEVFEFLSALFSSLEAVIFKLIASKVSPMSASKLLELINHDIKSWYLKIELAAFVEVLLPFRNFCSTGIRTVAT